MAAPSFTLVRHWFTKMVASLTRLPWNVFSRSLLHHDKFFVVTCTDRFSRLRHFSTQQRNSRTFERTVKDFLTYTVLISSLSYTIYKWKDDFRKQFSSFGGLFPTVQALSLPLSTISQNRDRYNFIADVVEISAPSVVYIEITDSRRFDRFTGRPIPTSSGSGFIVRHDGLILTNAHVVINKPNMAVKVRLHDGTTYQGIVEDVDMQSDLATVRINKKNLPVMKLGSSANLRPGEFVVAIGSPLSLSNSITSGVVSSPNRQSEELGLLKKHMGYIQTDAPITFGNSGGPLVNLNGEAIGINSMKVTAGISFAIPIDYAKEFLKNTEQRRANKGSHNVADTSKRRYIGVTMLTLTPDIIYEIQQKSGGIHDFVKHGVLIWKVVTGSPAHIGGLRAGDVVTHVNDEPVVAAVNIYKMLEKPGPLNITVVREREVLRIKVTPEEI